MPLTWAFILCARGELNPEHRGRSQRFTLNSGHECPFCVPHSGLCGYTRTHGYPVGKPRRRRSRALAWSAGPSVPCRDRRPAQPPPYPSREAVEHMDTPNAGRGTPEIPFRVITSHDVRASVKRAKRGLEKAADEIMWQIEMEAWVTLGYPSWSAMREAEYGGAAFMVPSKGRPELVARMRARGLTQREIADTAGVSQQQVSSDLRGLNTNFGNEPAPRIINARGQQRPTSYTRTEPEPNTPTYATCPTCGGTGKVTQSG